jgi:hypothetical protein
MQFPFAISHAQAEALKVALNIYSRNLVETELRECELYRYYIIRVVYVKIERKIISMAVAMKKNGTIKLDRVQCIALYKVLTTSPGHNYFSSGLPAIALNDFLLALGKSVPQNLNVETV